MYTGCLQVGIVCYQMDMTHHNLMQLHQSLINIADVASVSNIRRYISLETKYTVHLSLFIVGKL